MISARTRDRIDRIASEINAAQGRAIAVVAAADVKADLKELVDAARDRSGPTHIAEMKRLTTEATRTGALGVTMSRRYGRSRKDCAMQASACSNCSQTTTWGSTERFDLVERSPHLRPAGLVHLHAEPAEKDGWRTIIEAFDRSNAEAWKSAAR